MSTIKALVVGLDRSMEVVDLPTDGLLQAMYEKIGTDIVEAVDIADDVTVWVDEEGLLRPDPQVNWLATLCACAATQQPYRLFGVAVFTGGTDDDGETLAISDEAVDRVRQTAALAEGKTDSEVELMLLGALGTPMTGIVVL